MEIRQNPPTKNKIVRKCLIRRRDFIGTSLATVASFPGASVDALTRPPKMPVRFEQDRFCISFWVDPPADALMEKHYAQLAAADFTVAMGGFGANTPQTDTRQLDYCQKYGLKALVYLPGYEYGAVQGPSGIAKIRLADKFPNHAACWGYMLYDEPNTRLFPELQFMVRHLRTARPGRLGYVNLLPIYTYPKTQGAPTYDEYVGRFVREVDPDVLCADIYPFMQPSRNSQDLYCENLAVLRKYALIRRIPFWNYFNDMSFAKHRDPTEAQMRWQIYTSLAYGARGILYFCYWTPRGAMYQRSNAIISAAGIATRRYGQARRINARLKNLGPTLMQLTSVKVYRIPPSTDPAMVLKGSPLKSLTPGDYLIGVFKHADGRIGVLLNNYSYCYTTCPTVKFTAPLENISEVDPKTGREIPVVDDSPDRPGLRISLPSAEGRLFLVRE